MAHFAKINSNGEVTQVIVVRNEDILDGNGNESEEIGSLLCHDLFGGKWVQTSYNGSFRKNYAGVGFTYDEIKDAFIEPKPYDSLVDLSDYPYKEAMVAYRQALRDWTDSEDFPAVRPTLEVGNE